MRMYVDAHQRPARFCPHCQHQVDASTRFVAVDRGPRPGDMAFCFYCGRLSTYAAVFNEALVLVALSPEREAEMEQDPQAVAMRLAWLDYRQEKGQR